MHEDRTRHAASARFPRLLSVLSDYGMLGVLLLLCAFYSVVTWNEQHPTDRAAAEQLADSIIERLGSTARVLIATRDSEEDARFAEALAVRLRTAGATVAGTVRGDPADARDALERLAATNRTLDAIACTQSTSVWGVFEGVPEHYAVLGTPYVTRPESYYWPDFLKPSNLLNISNQTAVIATIAIGMTMVIITAGIDLSVGSLIALSAVVTAWLIRAWGGTQASVLVMILGCAGGISACAASGAFSGIMVTLFRIPPFIVTLAMMLVARGLAYIIAGGESNDQVPDSFVWLGRSADLFGVPNSVVLMLSLYGAAYFLMSRMTLGRYIYAVGGNVEAARLSGVPVRRVLLFVYTISGTLAGLGGVVMASLLKSGAPTYGTADELDVIAAVVVGGTSLMGGEGKVLGTLIGAFIIAVNENGMNLTGVGSYTQQVVLGLVILAAVLLDTVKSRRARDGQ